jgi:hypothetical protein
MSEGEYLALAGNLKAKAKGENYPSETNEQLFP